MKWLDEIGTYLHGLFENENIRHALMSHLHEKKGLKYVLQVADSELDVYEELADVVLKNVGLARVCEIIEIRSQRFVDEPIY